MKGKKKKILLAVIAVVLVAAIGAGIWLGTKGKAEPVNVYPFNYIGMTEYWGDSQESYGPITTDKIQTVYLSTTQTVTEILVAEGDTVKKGDLLMTFDTTLSDLQLERKRLDVEKLKLQLEDAKDRLQDIKNMKPMVIPTYTDTDDGDENLGTALTEAYRVSTLKTYDGSSRELSLICWLNSGTSVDSDLLEVLRQAAETYQNSNAQKQTSSASAPAESISEDVPEPSGSEPEPSGSEPEPSESTPEPSEDTPEPSESQPEPSESTPDPSESTPDPSESTPDPSEEVPDESTEAPEAPYEPFEVYSYYVIFKVTSGNMSLGSREVWQGLHVSGSASSGFRFKFFDAYGITDHTLAQEDADAADTDYPEIDLGSGYTSAQIAQMRSEQEKKIKDLEFDIKMAEADYKIMQTEVTDGNIYAQIDGEVVSVLTEDEAKTQQQPILKVSGGGGFYIAGSVSELEKDNMAIGQEVTVNDWNTGMTYTGTVVSLGDFPTSDGYWSGVGNPNVSYYPFSVFVDETADLQAGRYASIVYSSAASENGIYLRNPFVRTEQGKSYVYVQGENGRLEKRYVTTGKSLWGSYTESLSGLRQDHQRGRRYRGKRPQHTLRLRRAKQ